MQWTRWGSCSQASGGNSPEVLVADFGGPIPDRYSYDGQDSYLMARSFPDVAEASRPGCGGVPASPDAPPGDGCDRATPVVPTLFVMVAANVIGIGLAAGLVGGASPGATGGTHGRATRQPSRSAFPLVITTSEPLAFGLGFLGLALVQRERLLLATVTFGLAGLTTGDRRS